jgi:hypothetical protein
VNIDVADVCVRMAEIMLPLVIADVERNAMTSGPRGDACSDAGRGRVNGDGRDRP